MFVVCLSSSVAQGWVGVTPNQSLIMNGGMGSYMLQSSHPLLSANLDRIAARRKEDAGLRTKSAAWGLGLWRVYLGAQLMLAFEDPEGVFQLCLR